MNIFQNLIKNIQNNSGIIIALVLVSLFVVSTIVIAAETGNVSATVTFKNVSIAVSDGSVSYGTLGTGSTASTIATGVNDTQAAINTGNVTVNMNIMGYNSTPGSWTLSTTNGANQYTHEFCDNGTGGGDACDSSFTGVFLGTGYTALQTSVGVGTTERFDLRIKVPTTSSDYTPQSVNVTVQAVGL